MRKILFPALLILVASLIIYSCSKKEDNEISDNTEVIIYQKSAKTDVKVESRQLDLQERIVKASLIHYTNDLIKTLRENEDWNEYLKENQFTINQKKVTKTIIENNKVILLSIPFEKPSERGVLNVYKTDNEYVWTKVLISDLGNSKENYKFTNVKGELILKFDVYNNSEYSNFSFSPSTLVMKDGSSPVLLSADNQIPGEPGGDDCFAAGVSYYKCLECIIIKHCGNDLVCAVACGLYPYVCIGVSMLACLP